MDQVTLLSALQAEAVRRASQAKSHRTRLAFLELAFHYKRQLDTLASAEAAPAEPNDG